MTADKATIHQILKLLKEASALIPNQAMDNLGIFYHVDPETEKCSITGFAIGSKTQLEDMLVGCHTLTELYIFNEVNRSPLKLVEDLYEELTDDGPVDSVELH